MDLTLMCILWFKMWCELELYLGSQTFMWLFLWFFSLWHSFCLRLLWHASTELPWRTRRHHLEPQKSCWVCYQVQGARSVSLSWSVSHHFQCSVSQITVFLYLQEMKMSVSVAGTYTNCIGHGSDREKP